jgi:hypothetical protein
LQPQTLPRRVVGNVNDCFCRRAKSSPAALCPRSSAARFIVEAKVFCSIFARRRMRKIKCCMRNNVDTKP